MKALRASLVFRLGATGEHSLFTKTLIGYSSHVMQSLGMELCMHVRL